MKACISCGHPLDDQAKFCTNCGISQQAPQYSSEPATTSMPQAQVQAQATMPVDPAPAAPSMSVPAPMPPASAPSSVPGAPTNTMPNAGMPQAQATMPGSPIPGAPVSGAPYATAPGMNATAPMPPASAPYPAAPGVGMPAASAPAAPAKKDSKAGTIIITAVALLLMVGAIFLLANRSDDASSTPNASTPETTEQTAVPNAAEDELDANVGVGAAYITVNSEWETVDSESERLSVLPDFGGLIQVMYSTDMGADSSSSQESQVDAFFSEFFGTLDGSSHEDPVCSEITLENGTQATVAIAECSLEADSTKYKGYAKVIVGEDGLGAVVAMAPEDEYPNHQGTIRAVAESLSIEGYGNDAMVSEPTDEPQSGIISGSNTYEEGMFKVGTDIPAGEYRLEQTGDIMAYVCVSSDSSGDSIIDNENFDNCYYVTVEDGQYLEVTRAWFTPVDNYVAAQTSSVKDGMYRVGTDIPAGEYRLEVNSEYDGYYAIYDTSAAGKEILVNDIFETNGYVTVSEGQYLYLCRCTGELS